MLDEIGKQIIENNLVESLVNLSWKVKESFVVLNDANLNGSLENNVFKSAKNFEESNGIVSFKTDEIALKDIKSRIEIYERVISDQLNKKIIWKYSSANLKHTGIEIEIRLDERVFSKLYAVYFKKFGITYSKFRKQVYLSIAQRFVEYKYFLTYFFSASPILFDLNMEEQNYPKRNAFQSIESSENLLSKDFEAKNFSFGEANKDGDIQYLKLGKFDLYPLSNEKHIFELTSTLEVMFGYFLMTEKISDHNLDNILRKARQKNIVTANENPFSKSVYSKELYSFLNHLEIFAKKYNYNFENVAKQLKLRLKEPKDTLSAEILRNEGKKASLFEFLLEKSKICDESFDLEIDYNSYQLLKQALLLGMKVNIISSNEGIIDVGGRFIYQGLCSNKNGIILNKFLSDKHLTKQLVESLGYDNLKSWKIKNMLDLKNFQTEILNDAVVVKANDAISEKVHLFRMNPTLNELKDAVYDILSDNNEALVEKVKIGSIYRILLSNHKVISVVEKLPKSVVGNGKESLKKLIENNKLEFSNVESETIKKQGIRLEDIVPRGVEVLLRYDASTKTGAKFLDVLDQIDNSYLEEIERIAWKMEFADGELDFIIPNIYQPYKKENNEKLIFLSAHLTANYRIYEKTLLNKKTNIALKVINSWR